jgi:hypothetical protein
MADALTVTLIQPRHTYAPPETETRLGHVYMPTSLLSVAARLIGAGVTVRLVDENIARWSGSCDWVGVNLVGAPYVSSAIDIVSRAAKYDSPGVLLGGQVINGFTQTQFRTLFGESAHSGESETDLERVLGLRPNCLPSPEETSLVSAFRVLPENHLHTYLSQEIPFYVSRGCRHSCTFCAARRSVHGGRSIRETYRSTTALTHDLAFLMECAIDAGINELRLYLSNLDLFQTPEKLAEFAAVLLETRRTHAGVRLRIRALSNIESFLRVHMTVPELIQDLVCGGLERVGFGVDGASLPVFRAIRKPHAGSSLEDPFFLCSSVYGIVPETLMVFGHVGIDSETSMSRALELARLLYERYGALARPHAAKAVVPGNDGWRDGRNAAIVEFLINNPEGFQLLDFTALPSWLTHLDASFRAIARRYYLAACEIPDAITQYVLPEDPTADAAELAAARAFNKGRYDL